VKIHNIIEPTASLKVQQRNERNGLITVTATLSKPLVVELETCFPGKSRAEITREALELYASLYR